MPSWSAFDRYFLDDRPEGLLSRALEAIRSRLNDALRPEDALRAENAAPETLFTGFGDEAVSVGRAGSLFLGPGDDTAFIANYARGVFGGFGRDAVSFENRLGDYDLGISSGGLVLYDRLTGAPTILRGVEDLFFDGIGYERDALFAIARDDGAPDILVAGGTQALRVNDPDPTLSVVWDRAVQQAVIEAGAINGPTIASRAYAMVHTAIYDAFATFDASAVRVSRDTDGDNAALAASVAGLPEGDMAKAMNVAAHRVLSNLYPDKATTFDAILTERFGISTTDDGSAAYAVGLDAADNLLHDRLNDNANQLGGYADTTGHVPVNPSAAFADRNDITRWTPENVPIDNDGGPPDQVFLTPQWGEVVPFTGETFAVPDPEPFFLVDDGAIDLVAGTISVGGTVVYTAGLDDPATVVGSVVNPAFIAQAEAIVAESASLDDPLDPVEADRKKLIAEFWEDAGGTPFPPGTWMAFGQYVSARDDHDIVRDAKMFLAVANAVFEAGVHTWDEKVDSDYVRPVRAIRDLGKLGLLGEPGVDALTGETGFVIEAFAGFDPLTNESLGTQTILAQNFQSYQRPFTDPSPPFAEYTSGHSGFSAAAAEALRLFTGSDSFGGAVTFPAGSAQFDPATPAEPLTLSWETFKAAADEAGLSRIYGGIHFDDGDWNGRVLGQEIGAAVHDLAETFWTGAATDADRPFADAPIA